MKEVSATRLVVAGAGAFGREHMRVVRSMPGAVLAGVADIDPRAASAAAADFGPAPASNDPVRLLDEVRPDGLIVATPAAHHVPLAREALERGIPVLVEKPVALTKAEAAELELAENSSSAFVLPGHILRHSEPHRLLAGIVHSGSLGRLISITSRRHRDAGHAERYSESPVLMTMVHDIDLAIWLSGGTGGEVFALREPGHSHRSETLATIKADNGTVWRLATAWTFPSLSLPADRIEIVAEGGGVELEIGSAIRVFGPDPRVIDISGVHPDQALAAELAAFVHAIASGVRPVAVTLKDAIAGLAVADAIAVSLASGGIVRT